MNVLHSCETLDAVIAKLMKIKALLVEKGDEVWRPNAFALLLEIPNAVLVNAVLKTTNHVMSEILVARDNYNLQECEVPGRFQAIQLDIGFLPVDAIEFSPWVFPGQF